MSDCCDTPERDPACHHDHSIACHKENESKRHGDACCAPATAAPPSAFVAAGAGVRSTMRIVQMDCPTEETLIRNKLGGMVAVHGMEFNLMQRLLTVAHVPGAQQSVLDAVRSLGFSPELQRSAGSGQPAAPPEKPWWPLAAAGAAALASEAASWFGAPGWLPAALALLAVLASGTATYRKGWVALSNRTLNINALMSIAVTGALLLGQWPEAAMVMVLFAAAELVEARSLDRARDAIRGLMQLAPQRSTVRQADGSWAEADAASVAVGALVRVGPGERIGLDGTVTAGRSTVNQAPITGESLPIEKAEGDPVFAGTVNEAGSFDYTVTAAANDTALARIIHAVEQAQGTKAPTQRFVDRFARVYTPLVFIGALAVALVPPLLFGGGWHGWIYKALVLLVIACPCALVISTPVAIVSGLAAAARRGILVKGGIYLEEGRKLKWLALDKTGTITHGKPVQTDFEVHAQLDAVRCRVLAASLAGRSSHPVSQAIAQAADAEGVARMPVDAFEAIAGRGVRGAIDGGVYALGNHRLAHERGLCSPALEARLDALERQGRSAVLLLAPDRVLALFAVADAVKDSSRAAIADLHRLGVRSVMLSGDNLHTAQAIAREVGIDDARGDQLPDEKRKAVEALAAHGVVGMAGDGINDAPALAQADIGFAMGALGAGTAIETADVALMDDDLRKIPAFIRLSRATHAVLLQNIALALGIKALFLALTLAGLGTMWMAVFADVGVSLLVTGNGLRLLRR